MTKHIDVRHHFVRHYIKEGLIELFYVPTHANTADALTKALTPDVHNRHRDRLLRAGPSQRSEGNGAGR